MQSSLVIGETLNYTASPADYPASEGWTLRLLLNPRAGGTVTTVNSTASGDSHILTVSATTTANFVAGDYAYEVWAYYGTEYYRLDAGQLKVVQGLLGASAGTDNRTQAEIALDAAKAALAAWTPTTKSYSIAGRSMTFNTPAEIIQVVNHWESEVRREKDAARMAAGMATSRKVFVRMGRA